jgi:GRAM domain
MSLAVAGVKYGEATLTSPALRAYPLRMPPQTQLQPGEVLIKESRANLQRGMESVGGHLYLTDRRLIFESHKFNVQRGPTEIPLADVADVRKAWTKFLGVIPLAPNSIAVTTAGGHGQRIVCHKRGEWMEAIRSQADGEA